MATRKTLAARCASCGSVLTSTRKNQTQTVAGRTFVVTVAAGACRACASVFMEHASLERAEVQIACALARYGPLSGEAFRYVRKTLGMKAIGIAELLGVTPETISRWENGQRALDQTAWLAIGSIMLEHAGKKPETLERLRQLRALGAGAKEIHIDATTPTCIPEEGGRHLTLNQAALNGKSILVIEDNLDNCDLVVLLLQMMGAKASGVTSVQDGRASIEASLPDLVVCDLALPVEDGFAFLAWLRGVPRLAKIPVVALSGYVDQASREKVRAAGL